MTAVLRTLEGEPPLGIGGLAFRDEQGEWFEHHNPRYRSPSTKIGVLALEGGMYLAHPPGFRVDGKQHASREAALRAGIGAMIRKARKAMRSKDGEGLSWSEGYAGRVIDWALSLKPAAPTGRLDDLGSVQDGLKMSTDGLTAPGVVGADQCAAPNSPAPTDRYRISVQFSGGAASYVAAKIILDEFGHDGVALVFADTLIEDEDLYRFLDEAEEKLQHPIIRISEGRDPWTVFFDERMMGNSRADPCSKILKRRLLDKWRIENCAPNCTIVIGYDATEDFRFQPLKARMAPVDVRAPLLERGIWKERAYQIVEEDGLRLPRLYRMGFPHNNCGGFCVKAGHASFALLLEHLPDRYAAHEAREEEFRAFIGKDVSIMRDRRGGESRPLTMRAFRQRHQADPTLVDRSDLGGCTCMEPPMPSPDDAESIGDLDQKTYAAIDAGASISDPVVAALVEAHGQRKQFPAAHIFSMTTDVDDGRIVSVATCKCGQVIRFGSNDYVRMNAAIEAHWRRHPEGPVVDGRGELIKPGDASRIVGNKPRKRRKAAQPISETQSADEHDPVAFSGAGQGDASSASEAHLADQLAPADPAADEGARGDEPSHAPPAVLVQAAPIGATSGAWSDLLQAAAGLAWDDSADVAPAAAAAADTTYERFLHEKVVTAPLRGIVVAPEQLHPYLKPHCKDLVSWALRLGCAAIFASFGLHKTAMQLEWCRQLQRRQGGASLTVVPLGVRHGFIAEAAKLDMDVRFVRTNEEYRALAGEGVGHFLTNYESIREGKLDPNLFAAASLDEASVLRSYGSKTFQEFLPLFSKVQFKLVATATPSPNRYKELIHYAGFLGVMDTGLALTRFFQRNSEKAGDLTLYPHKEDEFWMWIHSWAAFLQKPSELGYSDEGYELPPLKINWHEVGADHSRAEPERDGQGVMFRDIAKSLSDAAKSRRDSLPMRIAKMMEIIGADPDSHRLIWHDLEAEREAIEQALPGVVTITGSMDLEERERRLHDFEEGRIKHFGTKPILSGSGSNFQYHCHKAVYLSLPGYGYKFNDFIQSLYRLQRFGQVHPVEIDVIYSEDERAGRAALEEKWALDTAMRARMSEIIGKHGLNTLPLRDALLRTMTINRVEIAGEKFRAINNDAVLEARTWPENSVDLIVTSIPFSNHYEYSASYRDFGHTDDNRHFWQQMDFLSCELLRMLRPGRLACIHVKDRILFGSVTGQGVPTVSPFHAEAIQHYLGHGFQFLGMITVVTDVVRENNQTYRLGWSENAKDSTKMGVGSPEYVLLFRKPQTDRTRSYADVPVVKSKDTYTRARWQIDAHALWRSGGNSFLTPEEFAALDAADHAKLFSSISADRIYDYEAHVAIGERLEAQGALPATFMAIAPGSHHPEVWHDVNRMRTLNMMQQRKGAEMHLCPLQFDIVDRLIERYSNEGELVYDPFGGLMTVPYRAILKKRRGAATELSPTYFADGVHYLRAAEEEVATPALFDLAAVDAANTPPPAKDK